MAEQHAVLIGSTGLIGHHLLIRLLEDTFFSRVTALVRRPFNMKHPKLDIKVVDFTNRDQCRDAMVGGTVLFCCIGTTQKQVKGNKATYRAIDFGIPVMTATLAKELGYRSMLHISAVGADQNASNFYLKLKGETDQALIAVGLPALSIFRPSLLLGNRKEFRVGEKIAQTVMPVLAGLLFGNWARYKPVQATSVADAMLHAAQQQVNGTFIHEYAGITALANEKLHSQGSHPTVQT